jgi:hypothetical protein
MRNTVEQKRNGAGLFGSLPLALALALAVPAARATAQDLPVFSDVLGGGEAKSDLSATDLGASVPRRIPVAPDAAEIRIPFRLADAGSGAALSLIWESGKKTELAMRIGSGTYKMSDTSPGALPESSVTRTLPDACLEMPGIGLRYFTRPNPDFYNEGELAKLQARWMSFPDPAAHRFLLSIRVTAAGASLSLDGNLAGEVKGAGRLKEIVIPLPREAEVTSVPVKPWTPYTGLDLRRLNRPGAMTNAVLGIDEAALRERGVPMSLPAGGANADVGCVRDVSPPNLIDTDGFARYHERSAFEGMPEALLMAVPAAPYARAWVLCAVEDDPARESAFNVRLTRFRKGGTGNAIVTTRVDVPRQDQAGGSNLWCVGTVRYGREKDRQKTVPLWLAEVSLNSSEIQDVVYSDWARGRLDFELLGLSRNSKSGVHVFAVTLEQSPVEMEVKQVSPGSVFHNDEKPEMRVALRPLKAGSTVLRWAVEDVWGATVATGEQACAFADNDKPRELPVSLAMAEFGWYKTVFSLHDTAGRLLLAHTAAFAQLPPDTRQAGYESPFGCWWQQYLHSHMTNPAIIGPLLLKAGLRRTTGTCESEAAMKPWKVTLDMIPWLSGYRPPGSPPQTVQEWFADYEKKVRDFRDRFPNSGMAMIFHESYDSGLAPEAWGGEPDPLTAHGLVEKAKMASALLREKFPELKIIVGNSGWSGALLSQLLRGGLPPDRIDGLGMERLIGYFAKDTMPPERHEASWTVRQVGLKYGCTAPPTDCYESGGRGNYGMSQGRIAQYVVRDSLVGFAWGYPYVGVGTISENVNGYYHTRWGGDSILRRSPLLYPQPQYVAIATMTRALDRAKLVRRVPTGSHTVYALEFARDGARVYALWTPRGTCEVRLTFAADGPVTIDGLYGRTRKAAVVGGELRVEAGEEVTYVTALQAASAILAGRRAFPLDQPPPGTTVVEPLTDPAAWTLTASKPLENGPHPYRWLPWRTTGKGRLAAVRDPEKGPCLGLELVAEGEVTELLAECVSFQAVNPAAVPGRPDTIGVWVKGNSSWGRVMFEIIDDEGERFRGGAYVHEPWGSSYIDFDGWCFVSLPLSENSPVRNRFYYNTATLWVNNGGNGVMDFPIRVAGFTVEMKRKALDLAEMADVSSTVLLKDLSVYGSPEGAAGSRSPAAGAPVFAAKAGPELLYASGDLGFGKPGARPAGFAEGAVLKEEAGLRFVSCEKGVFGLIRSPGYYGAHNWLDYEWTFRFRFPESGRLGFEGVIRTGFPPNPFLKGPVLGPEDRCKGVKLVFTKDGFQPTVVDGAFQMARGVTWAEKGLAPLEAGRWYRAVIRAAGRALDVSLEQDGRLVRVYRGPIPAGGGGLNLSSANPVDVADMEVRSVAPTAEDWSHAGRIGPAEGSPVPGALCVRIDGPFMITDAIALATNRPCILSAYIRAEKVGVPATLSIGGKGKPVQAGPEWKRFSFLATPQAASGEDSRCGFAVKGSDEGPVWVAAPRVEYAPADPLARRAAGWERSLERDYELDERAAHGGKNSLRSMPGGGCQAGQERELAAEEYRTLLLGGWYKMEGSARNARLQLELFRDRKFWSPQKPGDEEPRETFTLDLKPGGSGWTHAELKAVPKNAFKRYRLSVVSEKGMLWLDDLTLRTLGASGAPAVPAGTMSDLLAEKPAKDDEEELALLGSLGDGGGKNNLLENPGFEALMTNRIVTLRSDAPSPCGPTERADTWLKAGGGE